MKTPPELDALGYEKWGAGLCHVFAQALQTYLGRGEIGALWVNECFKHVYVVDGDLAYDFRAEKIAESDFLERWRTRYGRDAQLSKARVSRIEELAKYDVTFGDTWDSTLYRGCESERWLQEATLAVESSDFFRTLKNA